jgi:hypothetical protein
LKLKLAKESKTGKTDIVVAGRTKELFTTKTERVEATANDREKRAYVVNGEKLSAHTQ